MVSAARNAAATLPETLHSLQAQTLRAWEAIVVDDGSTDETAAIAASLAAGDSRIRVLQQTWGGVAAARNAGAAAASADWLLFLDADDWLLPTALEQLVGTIEADPHLGAAYGGWIRVDLEGERITEERPSLAGDLFDAFACRCVFTVNSCLVRRSLVEEAGGFDGERSPVEDWDLWQRLARMGTEFGAVDSILAVYRTRPGSESMQLESFLRASLSVIERGHAPDSRVAHPAAEHAAGRPQAGLPFARIPVAVWIAGCAVGRGEDPKSLLEPVLPDFEVWLGSWDLGEILFHSVPVGAGRTLAAWPELWLEHEQRIDGLLGLLARGSPAFALARRVRRLLERRIAGISPPGRPLRVGATSKICVELTEPLWDVFEEAGVLVCELELRGERLGIVELPVSDGVVPARVIADAAANWYAWELLGRFLGETVEGYERPHHAEAGWATFLRELWDRQDWTEDRFYEETTAAPSEPFQRLEDGRWRLEVSGELPSVDVSAERLLLELTVGGSFIGVTGLPGKRLVPADELVVAATTASGFELCRAAVREALVGRRRPEGASLRELLALAAVEYAEADAVAVALAPHPGGLVLARRTPETIGRSASRRAALPTEAAQDLVEAARVAGEAVVDRGTGGLVYAPDLLDGPAPDVEAPGQAGEGRPASLQVPDAYERTKYEQTLSLVPQESIERALELGCGDGHLTALLSSRVGALLATDMSAVALEHAAERCAGLGNVTVRELDLTGGENPGTFELIVCSDLLSHLAGHEELARAARKLADSLEPGGHLLSIHANVTTDDPAPPGFDRPLPFGAKTIGETLAATPPLHPLEEIRTPLYRIQLFEAVDPTPSLRPLPKIIEVAAQPPAQTEQLPILVYHRTSTTGRAGADRYCLAPDVFEAQLRYLRDAGYHSVGLEDWGAAVEASRPLRGRAVLITFDDGYVDFETEAWPLLKRYGFLATVFLVAGEVGGTNRWDSGFADEAALLDWPQIRRLQDEGVTFGSHSTTHPPLTGVTNGEVVHEAARSRSILQAGLGRPVPAFAFPYGDVDPAVEHLVGACGYTFGLKVRAGKSELSDALLDLPRIEVLGDDRFKDFVRKLEEGS